MTTTSAVTLNAVIEQFVASQQTLDAAAEKLRSITLAEDGAQRASASLDEAAGQLANLAAQLAEGTSGLAQAQESARLLLERSRELLETTELASLREDVSELRSDLQRLVEFQHSSTADVGRRLDEFHHLTTALEAERAARSEVEHQLAAAREIMSDRQLKRLDS